MTNLSNNMANNMANNSADRDIVFTGIGMITAHGYGFSANMKALYEGENKQLTIDDYRVKGFNPAPYLSDRKVVKVVSPRDVLGLVAFEECVKNAGVRHEQMNPDRTGLYVGAPPSATTDNQNYAEAIEATRNSSGDLIEAEFGNTFRSASPTTLLSGLPNNVLCYGSKTLDARGPNSNYTMLETSGHLAVIGASRAMRLGRLDCAIAGGFTAHTDPVILTNLRRRGILKVEQSGAPYVVAPFGGDHASGTITADGAAFIAMELRSDAAARGVKPIATLLSGGAASAAQWPGIKVAESRTLEDLILEILNRARVFPEQVGLISLSGSGVSSVDHIERQAVMNVFAGSRRQGSILPPLVCTTSIWGNLMEAGGVAEIGALAIFCANGVLPKRAQVDFGLPQREFQPIEGKTVGLILRTSAWGEYTGLVIRY